MNECCEKCIYGIWYDNEVIDCEYNFEEVSEGDLKIIHDVLDNKVLYCPFEHSVD